MRDQINKSWETITNFEPYDWFLVVVITVFLLVIPKILTRIFYWVMRKFFKLERMKWVKGWKKIKD